MQLGQDPDHNVSSIDAHHASRITHHEVFMSENDTIKNILRMFNYGLFVATSASCRGAARRDRELGHTGILRAEADCRRHA